MTLYPFLDAQTGTVAGLSERHWRQLGATLREIHGAGLPPDLERAIGSETFLPSRRSVLDHLDAAIARRDPADAVQGELATLWAARRSDIGVVIERCDALARGLRTRCLPLVLCHADLHTWNVLLDKRRRMWIVDWDETVLAPKERDLMFVVGGILAGLVSPRQTECFMRGYGEATIDEQALAYYRYAWAVQDMAAYAELVFFAAELGDVSRRHALRGFVSLFEPGGIVAIALSSRSAIA
jgi:spectinomycin phosphotransferase